MLMICSLHEMDMNDRDSPLADCRRHCQVGAKQADHCQASSYTRNSTLLEHMITLMTCSLHEMDMNDRGSPLADCRRHRQVGVAQAGHYRASAHTAP